MPESRKYRRLVLAYLLAPVPAFIMWAMFFGLGNHYGYVHAHPTLPAIYALLAVQAVFGFIFLALSFLKIEKWFVYPLVGFLICWPFAAIFWVAATGDWSLPSGQIFQFILTHLSDFSSLFPLSSSSAFLIGAVPGYVFWLLAKSTRTEAG